MKFSGPASRILSAASFILGMCLILYYHSYIARLMADKAMYGRFAYALSIGVSLSQLIGLGLPAVLLREVARLEGLGKAHSAMRTTTLTLTILSVSCLISLCVVIALNLGWLSSESQSVAWSILVVAVGTSWLQFGELLAKAQHRFLFSQVLPRLFFPIGVVGLVYLWHHGLNKALLPSHALLFVGLLLGATGATMLASGLWRLMRSRHSDQSSSKEDVPNWRGLLKIALPMLLTSGLGIIMDSLDIIMLKWMSGSAESGQYSAVIRLASFVGLPLWITNIFSGTIYASKYGQGDLAGMQQAARSYMWRILPLTILISLGLILFSHSLLSLFGDSFAERGVGITWILVWLIGGQLVNGCAGSSGLMLNMTGHEKTCTIIFAISAVLNAILNFLLIPRLGAIGAGVATASSLALWNIIMIYWMRTRIGVDTSVLGLISQPVTKGNILKAQITPESRK